MGRKISGGRKKMEEEEEDALRDPFLEQTLKIPQDFISEMKEAFRYFDKVGISANKSQIKSEWQWLSYYILYLRVAVAFSAQKRCQPC